ncbi:hypothetical protein ACQ4PT_050897 [Festuca glaucescens]
MPSSSSSRPLQPVPGLLHHYGFIYVASPWWKQAGANQPWRLDGQSDGGLRGPGSSGDVAISALPKAGMCRHSALAPNRSKAEGPRITAVDWTEMDITSHSYLADVIGQIVHDLKLTRVLMTTNTPDTAKRAFTLRDQRNAELKFVLWRQRAAEFNDNG